MSWGMIWGSGVGRRAVRRGQVVLVAHGSIIIGVGLADGGNAEAARVAGWDDGDGPAARVGALVEAGSALARNRSVPRTR